MSSSRVFLVVETAKSYFVLLFGVHFMFSGHHVQSGSPENSKKIQTVRSFPSRMPDFKKKLEKKNQICFSKYFLQFLNFQIHPNLELLSMDLILRESITLTWYVKCLKYKSWFSPIRQDLSGKFGCPVLSGQETHMPSPVEP